MKFFFKPSLDGTLGVAMTVATGAFYYWHHVRAQRIEAIAKEQQSEYENEYQRQGYQKIEAGNKIVIHKHVLPFVGATFFTQSSQPRVVWRDAKGAECEYDEGHQLKK